MYIAYSLHTVRFIKRGFRLTVHICIRDLFHSNQYKCFVTRYKPTDHFTIIDRIVKSVLLNSFRQIYRGTNQE